MQITIDTRDELTSQDKVILAALMGAALPATPGTVPAAEAEGLGPRLQREAKERAAADRKAKAAPKAAEPEPEPEEDEDDEPEVVEVTEPEPQPKRTRRPRAAKKPEPEPEPEPEEAEDEDEDEDDEEDLIGGTEPTLDDAVAQATELVGAGQGAKVKAALKKLGVARVSALKGKAIADFLAAIA